MDEFEQGIASMLTSVVPEPGHEIDIDDVRALTRPGHASVRQRVRRAARRRTRPLGMSPGRRRWPAIAGSVAAATVIAVGTYVLTSNGNQSRIVTTPGPATRSQATTDPTALTSTSWQLVTLIDASGTATPASAPVIFTFGNGAVTDHVGDSTSAHITPGRVTLGTWTNDLLIFHAPHLDIAQTNFIGTLFDGTLDWSIDADTLTLARPGRGSLVFHRASYNPNAFYGSVSGRFVATGGPPGVRSPRPIRGTGTVQFADTRSGMTQTVDTDTGGQYGAYLPPGTYTVTGHISSYNDGHAECTASTTIHVTHNATTQADLNCVEK